MGATASSRAKAARRAAEVEAAYVACERIARTHYENFSFASLLLPSRQRRHMCALYCYCRGVDDVGDESPGDRLALLDDWERELRSCYSGVPERQEFLALQSTIRDRDLPLQPFLDLIEANRRDQWKSRYRTFGELMDYCALSANPVGRLVLYLWGHRNPALQRLSDYTCTALQLANFWQDVGRDLSIGRIYLPQEDLDDFGYTEGELTSGVVDHRFRELMRFEVERTRQLFRRGLKLVSRVAPSLRVDLLLFSLGGMELLGAIESIGFDVLHQRPIVSNRAKARLLFKALVMARLSKGEPSTTFEFRG